jgi:inhibitor of cysteine peptidase
MPIVQLNQANNGNLIQLSQGEMIEIQLPENPTTGYRWEIEQPNSGAIPETASETASVLQFQTSRFVPISSGVGSGGNRILSFKAAQPGTVQLQLKLWQPWSGEASVVERYCLTLEITA